MKRTTNIQLMILGLALCASPGVVSRAQAEPGGASQEADARDDAEDKGSKPTQRVPVTQEQVTRLGIKITRAVQGAVRDADCDRR